MQPCTQFFHEPIWTTFSVLNSVWNLLAIPNVNRYAITKLEHMSLILVSKMCCLTLYLNYLILNDIAKGNFWFKLLYSRIYIYYPCYQPIVIPWVCARITLQISLTRATMLYACWHHQWSKKSNFNTWL